MNEWCTIYVLISQWTALSLKHTKAWIETNHCYVDVCPVCVCPVCVCVCVCVCDMKVSWPGGISPVELFHFEPSVSDS